MLSWHGQIFVKNELPVTNLQRHEFFIKFAMPTKYLYSIWPWQKCEFYLQDQNTTNVWIRNMKADIIVLYSLSYWREEAIIRFINFQSNIFQSNIIDVLHKRRNACKMWKKEIIMTTSGVTTNDIVIIMVTFGFQCIRNSWSPQNETNTIFVLAVW